MTKIFEQAEYMINTIKDHYSISLQLYYIDNDPRWHQHIDICLDLIHKLQELDNYAKEIRPELLSKVYSLSGTKEYSVWVV
jgi:hypothetical protein